MKKKVLLARLLLAVLLASSWIGVTSSQQAFSPAPLVQQNGQSVMLGWKCLQIPPGIAGGCPQGTINLQSPPQVLGVPLSSSSGPSQWSVVSAAGTTQQTATILAPGNYIIKQCPAGSGVIPDGTLNEEVRLRMDCGGAVKVYPFSGSTLGTTASHTAVNVPQSFADGSDISVVCTTGGMCAAWGSAPFSFTAGTITESPDQTFDPPSSQIVNSAGDVFSLAGTTVFVNGTADNTHPAILVYYTYSGPLSSGGNHNVLIQDITSVSGWWAKGLIADTWTAESCPLPNSCGESPLGSTVIGASGQQIINVNGEAFSINSSAQVQVSSVAGGGGVADPTTSNVAQLYYNTGPDSLHDVFYRNNSNACFWKHVASDPWTSISQCPIESLEGTDITVVASGGVPAIIGSDLTNWTLAVDTVHSPTTGNVVAINGVQDATTANVIELLYHNHQIFYKNGSSSWWKKRVPTDPWTPTSDPYAILLSLSANPTTVTLGQSSTITWNGQGATSCTSVDIPNVTSISGSSSVTPPSGGFTYHMTCANLLRSVSKTVKVNVQSVTVTASLSASPSTILQGASSTLTWSSTGATSCAGSGGTFNTSGATSGSTSTGALTVSTTYTVTCQDSSGNNGQATATVTVTTNTVTASLSASPSTINVGQSSTLTWSSTSATSCAGTGFPTAGATSGTASVSPTATKTYKIDCQDAFNNHGTAQTTVTVNVPNSTFPWKTVSGDHYLVDNNGNHVLMIADAAWNLICKLNVADATTYFSSRAAAGYNAALVDLAPNNAFNQCPGMGTVDGIPFFNTGTDFSTVNSAYLARVDAIVAAAAANNIVLLFDPADAQQYQVTGIVQANGVTKMLNYGALLGARYNISTAPNVMWFHGNDYDCNDTDDQFMAAVAKGIKNATNEPIQSVLFDTSATSRTDANWNGTTSVVSSGAYVSFDSVITYAPAYATLIPEYGLSPVMPVGLTKTCYYDPNGNNGCSAGRVALDLRAQNWWSALSGASVISGDNAVWGFCTSTSGCYSTWQTAMTNLPTGQVTILSNFFGSLGSTYGLLVPDSNHSVVTSGFGTPFSGDTSCKPACLEGSFNYVATARASDGSLIVSYLSNGQSPTVDMTKLASASKAQWFDPTSGTFTLISNSLPNTGSKTFSPPGNNSLGQNDWVLVLGTISGSFIPGSSGQSVVPSVNPQGTITDNNGDVWALSTNSTGGVTCTSNSMPPNVCKNGSRAGSTSLAVALVFQQGTIYYEACAVALGTNFSCAQPGNWFSWNGSTWTPASNPYGLVVSLSANPSLILAGGTSTLTLSTSKANSCAGSGPGLVIQPGVVSGDFPVSPTSSSNYSVLCQGPGNTQQGASAVVNVSSPGQTSLCPYTMPMISANFPLAVGSQTPIPACAFLNSIGVTVGDTGAYTSLGSWLSLLVQGGFKHVQGPLGAYPIDANIVNTLGLSGISFLLGKDTGVTAANPQNAANIMISNAQAQLNAGLPVSIRGASEGNINFPCWPSCVSSWQKNLSTAIKNLDPTFGLAAPSVLSTPTANTTDDPVVDALAAANPSCCQTTSSVGDLHQTGGDPNYGGYGNIGQDLFWRNKIASMSPVWNPNNPALNSFSSWNSADSNQAMQALMAERHYFEMWRWNIAPSDEYQFLDNGGSGGFLDGSYAAKTAYNVIKSMTTLLADVGVSSLPPFSYTLTGTSPLANCTPSSRGVVVEPADTYSTCTRSLLFGKNTDSTYWVAIWEQTEVVDGLGGILTPPTQSVTLHVPGSHNLTAYEPIAQDGTYHGVTSISSCSACSSLAITSNAGVTLVKVQ